MSNIKIIPDTNPHIRLRSSVVPFPLSKEHLELGQSLLAYLKYSSTEQFKIDHPNESAGVGLAAPQVDAQVRMFALYFTHDGQAYEHIFINPKVLKTSLKMAYMGGGEGCLSVKKKHDGYVYRPYKVTFQAYDLVSKKDVEMTFVGYPAIVFGHEYDHLNGCLYYDHIDDDDPFYVDEDAIEL
jgi:peptide deformylase